MTCARGMKDVLWRFRPDGKVESIFWVENTEKISANTKNLGFWNSSITLWDDNFLNNHYYDFEYDLPNARGDAYNRIYKNYPPPAGTSAYLGVGLSADEMVRLNSLATDLNNYRRETHARWITTNANIDAEWDAYVARMKALGADEWLALRQKTYDLAAK